MYVMGDNGVFKQAKDAKDKTDRAKLDEQDYFNNIENTIDKYVNGSGGESKPVERVDVSTITEKVDKNTPAKDSLENPITIPAGFKVVPDGEDGVAYTYTGDKKPAVQDGIVIEDEEGNQFVWIPIGEIKNKSGDSNGPSTTIQLARHTFNITIDPDTYEIGGTGSIKTTKTDGSGLKDEWIELAGVGYEYLEEVSTSTTDADQSTNTRAKNIGEFISKAKSNGGYYLARYEASYKNSTHCYSKKSTSTRTEKTTALTSGMLWNYITQPDAATVARNMYTSTSYESDLVNSYAWDTAIVFIQTYSGDSDYSKEVGPIISSSLVNTGTTTDKRCNIYDMASNTAEWTTETSAFSAACCTRRGENYYDYGSFTANRGSHGTSGNIDYISFRSLIYVK